MLDITKQLYKVVFNKRYYKIFFDKDIYIYKDNKLNLLDNECGPAVISGKNKYYYIDNIMVGYHFKNSTAYFYAEHFPYLIAFRNNKHFVIYTKTRLFL